MALNSCKLVLCCLVIPLAPFAPAPLSTAYASIGEMSASPRHPSSVPMEAGRDMYKKDMYKNVWL